MSIFIKICYLKKEMLLYAKSNLSKDEKFDVVISDSDLKFQDVAANLGFMTTSNKFQGRVSTALFSAENLFEGLDAQSIYTYH
ncbi:hypothetical protein SAMN05446037_101813 [Anaerovirgula multivorans]|uniref:Uncharacterized protein n=1 Tax=Anaerovirgula multivorans TaxID=312168 RepID=A0A239GS50_9FIRM|nr:hypothetical protein [Anaerovirgula multivorans]SNS70904.1 hypothetical protein SAMN05446037_101813 [Anaerovirgula multivorans]